MSKYDDREELAAKVEWEGGVSETILGYGITVEDLPDETPAEVRAAWARMEAVSPDERMIGHWLETGEVKSFT